jgi:hypothetical protein
MFMDEIEATKRGMEALDAAIEEALHIAALEPAPPGLYRAVMEQIQAQDLADRAGRPLRAQPVPFAQAGFRITWLDLALSLFGAGMLALTGILWSWLPAPVADYLRMQALYEGQQLVYLDRPVLIWCGLALAALLAGVLAGLWSCLRLGVCNRRSA